MGVEFYSWSLIHQPEGGAKTMSPRGQQSRCQRNCNPLLFDLSLKWSCLLCPVLICLLTQSSTIAKCVSSTRKQHGMVGKACVDLTSGVTSNPGSTTSQPCNMSPLWAWSEKDSPIQGFTLRITRETDKKCAFQGLSCHEQTLRLSSGTHPELPQVYSNPVPSGLWVAGRPRQARAPELGQWVLGTSFPPGEVRGRGAQTVPGLWVFPSTGQQTNGCFRKEVGLNSKDHTVPQMCYIDRSILVERR